MALLAIVVLAAAGTTIYLWAREALRGAFDSALLTVAQIEVEAAVDDPDGSVHLHEGVPVPLPAGMGPAYEKVILIKSADGAVDLRSVNLVRGPTLEADPTLERRALGGTASYGDARRGDAVFRCIYYPFSDSSGRRLLAVVGISREPLERTLRSLLVALGVCLTAGGAAAAWGANRLARRLTRPLERIAEGAREVGEASLSARIPEVSPDVELRDVVAILNAMLERLEAAFQAQRRFLADASHELRSPLANVRGTIEVALRRARSGEEYRDALAVALPEVERLSRLVNDLLRLSRADTGQLPFAFAPCQLPAVAEDAVKAHASRAGERSVRLALDAPEPLEVMGDPDRLREVVDNLLDNAIRHAPRGSTVTVGVRREGARARLSVRDAGPGLSPQEQARVFDRFYRADGSRARNSGGMGLGLSIAKAIVDAHRGRISVRSAPGEGSCFLVDLPLAPAAAPAT
jgi:two-component system OmpR family sensor kinase